MTGLTLNCLKLLIVWIELPLRRLYGVFQGKASSPKMWLILAILLCVVGTLIDLLVYRSRRPKKEEPEKAREPLPSERELPVFTNNTDPIGGYEAATPYTQVQPETFKTPVFDEQLPPRPAYRSRYTATPEPTQELTPGGNRRRRQNMIRENLLSEAVQGGVQTVHTMEEMEQGSSSGKLKRLAKTAINFMDLGGDAPGANRPGFQSSVKRNEAYFDPVYPESDRDGRSRPR